MKSARPDLLALHETRIAHGIYPEPMVPVVEELLAEIKRLQRIEQAVKSFWKASNQESRPNE